MQNETSSPVSPDPLFSEYMADAADEIAKGILETMSEDIGGSPAIVILQAHVAQEFMTTAVVSIMSRILEIISQPKGS